MTTLPPFIDYSQYSVWWDCPMKWFERYIKGVRQDYPDRPRDDARAIGTATHNALARYYTTGSMALTPEDTPDFTLTPEAHQTVKSLLWGYAKVFAGEPWSLATVEQPITFHEQGVPILAKIDSFFQLEQEVSLPQGLDNEVLVLESGIWIQEHKTKSEGHNVKFMQRWEVDMQAAFQLLTLNSLYPNQVRGIIINVLEKPRNNAPRRKCKGCNQYSLFEHYLIAEGGKYACPHCGHPQKLAPLGDSLSYQPSFWRMKVTRTKEALDDALTHILKTRWMMEDAYDSGEFLMNHQNCVHPIYGPCEFFEPHLYRQDPLTLSNFIKVDALKYTEPDPNLETSS